MTLWILILLVVGLGALLWLLEKAPFISESAKPLLRWIILAAMVFIVLDFLGVITYLKSYVVRK